MRRASLLLAAAVLLLVPGALFAATATEPPPPLARPELVNLPLGSVDPQTLVACARRLPAAQRRLAELTALGYVRHTEADRALVTSPGINAAVWLMFEAPQFPPSASSVAAPVVIVATTRDSTGVRTLTTPAVVIVDPDDGTLAIVPPGTETGAPATGTSPGLDRVIDPDGVVDDFMHCVATLSPCAAVVRQQWPETGSATAIANFISCSSTRTYDCFERTFFRYLDWYMDRYFH